jgi:hypothetical protein
MNMPTRALTSFLSGRAIAHALFTALVGLAFLALLFVLFLAAPAFAQEISAAATTVEIPYGRVIVDGTDIVLGAISIAAAAAFRFVPAHVRWALQLIRAEQLFDKALAKVRAEIGDEFATKAWSVDARNEAVAIALRYSVAHYGTLVEKLGGADLVKEKLAARLQELIERVARR